MLFHEIELSGPYELNEVVFKRVFLGLNPKREVLCLNSRVDV